MKILLITVLSIFLSLNVFSQKVGTEIGDIAPDIKLPNPAGDSISLSSLRGKLVLIDFWASWCGPCRRENPIVVEAYINFKEKNFSVGRGFEIYGVSLDKTKENWEKGIADDKLTWINVSDLAQWNCVPAKVYGVRGIPANFLIDKDGVILAKNLRGEALESTLAKYLMKDSSEEFAETLKNLGLDYNRLSQDPEYANKKELKKIKKNIDSLEKLTKALKNK